MNKRNSDSFIPDNAKARKTVTVTNTKHRKSVIVPFTEQLRSIRVDHEALKVYKELEIYLLYVLPLLFCIRK